MCQLFKEIIDHKDVYLLPLDLDKVEPMSDTKYKTIKFEDYMQETSNLSFLGISLYRQYVDSMDEQWKDYMKRMTLYLAKKGIFRVTISRLRQQGLLMKEDVPSEFVSAQAIEEVLAFDRLMNPLLTYFGKYEGRSNYLYLRKED